ncbi:unnamed protein product [Symbiodinium sp. CCMP2456]|nr:unnamed protein product [Symbiodinium sp. CCMP2456]
MPALPRLLLAVHTLYARCASQPQHSIQVHAGGEVTNVSHDFTMTSAANVAGAKGHLIRSAKLIQDDVDAEVEAEEHAEEEIVSNESSADWQLAVYVSRHNVMMYNWGGWTNCNEFDAGGDKKTKFYCVRAKKIKVTFEGAPRGEFTYSPNGKKTLKDMLTGRYVVHGDVNHWRAVTKNCYQSNCNARGFQPLNRCRYGFVTNNENDCNSCDHSAGVGCNLVATGSKASCCSTRGPGCHENFKTKIEILPVTCDKDVCADGEVLKEEGLPEFCEGEECTSDECCATTTTTTTAKSGAFGTRMPPLLLLSPLAAWLARYL